MSIEDLMKPRIIVLSDWPGVAGRVTKGDIFTENEDGIYWIAGEPFLEDKIKDYPVLFRFLNWYEERAIEDMPEYVKDGNAEVLKAMYRKGIETENGLQPDRIFVEYANGNTGEWAIVENVMCFFEPATESEYLTYKNKQL